MSPHRKHWWHKYPRTVGATIDALTGEMATIAFRGLMSVAAVWMITGASKIKEIYHLPEKQAELTQHLKEAIDSSIKKVTDAEEEARKSLVTRIEITKQIADWDKERNALSQMVESHDQRLGRMDAKIDNIQQSLDKLLFLMTQNKSQTSSNEHAATRTASK